MPIQLSCLRDSIRLLLDQLAACTAHPSPTPKNKQKIAILRLDGMGDLVLFLDALRGFRQHFSSDRYEICLLTEAWLVDLVKDCPWVDRVMPIDQQRFRKTWGYRARILREVRQASFDIFINACLFRKLSRGDNLVRASGARLRYGFEPQPDQPCERRLGNRFYTHLVADRKWQVHELERNAALVRAVGLHDFECARPVFPASLAPQKGDYFVIAPAASSPVRSWPISRFAELAGRLHRLSGFRPMLVGAASDMALMAELVALAPDLPWIKPTPSSLSDLAATLAQAQFVIANDSGPMHLAMAVGAKTVAIVPGGEFDAYPGYPTHLRQNALIIHDQETACFNCRWHCIYDRPKNAIKPCLENITVEQAFQQIRALL